ncbi:hypothetical protein SALBM311S_02293 [Streptomyces alboniger]
MSLRDAYGGDVLISGSAHSPFGRLDATLERLVVETGSAAITDAGLEPRDIDAVFLGQFNAGMEPLAFASSLALQISDGLWGKPATRVENACASGSAAVHQGITAILAGTAHRVLVVGAEKMTAADAQVVGAGLLGADYDLAGQSSSTGFAGLFATVARAVNPSGGLKSKGHPVGATGVSQHVLTAMQLTGMAGDMQLPCADLAAIHNMGGLAVANYVSVLGR